MKVFNDEKDAAKYAYTRVAESTMMHQETDMVKTKEEEKLERMQELVEFYKVCVINN